MTQHIKIWQEHYRDGHSAEASMLKEIAELRAEVIARCRAEGGVTCNNASSELASNTATAAPGDLSKQLRELAERTDGDTFIPVLPEFLAGVADELDRLASNAGGAPSTSPV